MKVSFNSGMDEDLIEESRQIFKSFLRDFFSKESLDFAQAKGFGVYQQ